LVLDPGIGSNGRVRIVILGNISRCGGAGESGRKGGKKKRILGGFGTLSHKNRRER